MQIRQWVQPGEGDGSFQNSPTLRTQLPSPVKPWEVSCRNAKPSATSLGMPSMEGSLTQGPQIPPGAITWVLMAILQICFHPPFLPPSFPTYYQ